MKRPFRPALPLAAALCTLAIAACAGDDRDGRAADGSDTGIESPAGENATTGTSGTMGAGTEGNMDGSASAAAGGSMGAQPAVTGATPGAGGAAAGAGGGAGGALPVAMILSMPAQHVGQPASGTAQVAEVVSDRGFYVQEGGQRIFVVMNEPMEKTREIRAGQRLQIAGTVYNRAGMGSMPPLEAGARRIVEAQPAFLFVARPTDITVVGQQ